MTTTNQFDKHVYICYEPKPKKYYAWAKVEIDHDKQNITITAHHGGMPITEFAEFLKETLYFPFKEQGIDPEQHGSTPKGNEA